MQKSALSATVALPLALAQAGELPVEHLHVVRTGTLLVEAPPGKTFELFTGPGEELWIEEWEPTVLSGDGLTAGTVFLTDIGEPTIWIVVDFDRDARHARYARVAPLTRAGTVDVRVAADAAGESIVTVTYELTALSEDGNRMLEEFDEAAYAGMMKQWEQMIRDADIDFESGFFAKRR